MARTHWDTKLPTEDCMGKPITDEFIDGVLIGFGGQTGWAIMTPETHHKYGVGLGTGKGQRYRKQPDGRFAKVEG
jgi:hypothetical protein